MKKCFKPKSVIKPCVHVQLWVKMRLFGLMTCLLLSLFVVGCNKDKDEITEEEARVVLANAEVVSNKVSRIFESSATVEEMAQHLNEIKAMENVEDAWQDDNTIAVKIKDGGIIRWCYFPIGGLDEKVGGLLDIIKDIETKDNNKDICKNKNVCIAITTPFDESRASFRMQNGAESNYYKSWKKIKKAFEQKGYIVCPKDEEDEYEFYYGELITPEFYCDLLPEFGVNIIITHGDCFNGVHWIMTGEEVNNFSSQMYFSQWRDGYDIESWKIKEKRNGNEVIKWYYAISQNYLSINMKRHFSDNSLLFMWACKTMKNNYNFSNFFRDRGLGCYFGYDDTVRAYRAGRDLDMIMQYMLLDGLTAGEAYDKLGRGTNPHLLLNPENCDITLVEKEPAGERACLDNGFDVPNSARSVVFEYNSSVTTGTRLDSEESQVPIYGNLNGDVYTISTSSNQIYAPSDCSRLFWYEDGLEEIDFGIGFNTGNVTNMNEMFYRCSSLTSLNLSGWNTENVEAMDGMFYRCSSLTSLNLSGWNTENVVIMSWMFGYCSSLTSLNLSGWNTENVEDMEGMFSDCSSLTSLNLLGWNLEKVEDMEGMFQYCSSLTSLNLSGWNTENVYDMRYMFSGCSSLTSLNLRGWNTGDVVYMTSMFYGCSSLTSLNLSEWNTGNVENMRSMFSDCYSLTSLNLSGWNTGNVEHMEFMFSDCSSLTSLNVANFDMSNVGVGGTQGICFSLAETSQACIITCTSHARVYLSGLDSGLNEDYITWNIVGKKKNTPTTTRTKGSKQR